MTESATGLRERRKADTLARMKSTARHLTAERGLGGFTIDELCAEVDVSRRTFFNSFSSQENAVLGLPAHLDTTELNEAFVAGASTDRALLDDFADLQLARWELFELSPTDGADVAAAIEREPRLLSHILALSAEGAREDIALIRRREGLAASDIRAAAVVHFLGTVFRLSTEQYFSGASGETFRQIFQRHLAVFRAIAA
ncbi:hypothetical protein BH11ACT2_BH11ACT2_13630 [soil metagenome]